MRTPQSPHEGPVWVFDEYTGEYFDLGFVPGEGLTFSLGKGPDGEEPAEPFGLLNEVRATGATINPILAYIAARVDEHLGDPYGPDQYDDWEHPLNAERRQLLTPIIPRLAAVTADSAEIDVALTD